VVFRRPAGGPLLADTGWEGMRVCGDWLFYLHLIRGGKLAYSVDCNNYYRLHPTSTAVATHSTPVYYREHESIARYVARWFRASGEALAAHRGFIERFFSEQGENLAREGQELEDFYDPEKVQAELHARGPNVLIASFGFVLGGGEVFPIRLANALKQNGYSVTFFDFGGAERNTGMREMLHADIPVVERVRGAGIADAATVIEDFGIDVVHTHHASVDRFFSEAKERSVNPPKLVVTMHGMYEAMDGPAFKEAIQGVRRSVDHWVYISEKNVAPFRKAGAYSDRLFTKIPNGMELSEVTPADRADHGLSNDAFLVCLASRAIPEKGWRTAIEAVGEARRTSGMDIVLILLGEGPVHDDLAGAGVPDYVYMPGFVNDAIGFYAMSDIGLLPSTFPGESAPLTVIECLMAGKPMIASDVGEIADMMSDEQGSLAGELIDISSGRIDVAEVARLIVSLASDPAAYAEKVRVCRAISPRFRMESVVRQYLSVYSGAVAQGGDAMPAH
jgi:glycosyltransferase involved in cell wall biosynthesis